MKHYIFSSILFCFFILNSMAQEVLQTSFYNINLPKGLTYQKMNSTNEDLMNVDVYKILNHENRQVKYLTYLMSNKLNINLDAISDYDLNKYLLDIGNVSIEEKKPALRSL